MKANTLNGFLLAVLMLGLIIPTNAQTEGKSLVKWNIGALVLKNFSFQYERAINDRMSLAAGVRFSPKSGLPFKSAIKDLVGNDDTWESIQNMETANFAFTPEVRFYLGKGVFEGFYLAPFARIANYSANLPFKFTVNYENFTSEEMIPLDGSVTTITAGVLLGAQWKLGRQLYLDWWIAGPNYGVSNGSINGRRMLTDYEQEALRNELDKLDDIALIKSKYAVDGNGAKVDFDGPWAGIRSGLSIGLKF